MVAAGMTERVRSEVAIHSRLQHPRIVQVGGFVRAGDGGGGG
jgi:hypothetical protein